MSTLQQLSRAALTRGPDYPAVEWAGRWVSWEDMRRIADLVTGLLHASGADPRGQIGLLPRNRPAIIAAILGLIADSRTIRMVHTFQSPSGIARDLDTEKPVAVVGMEEDFSPEVRAVLEAHGIAGIALLADGAIAIAGCEGSFVACEGELSEPRILLLTSGTTGPPKQFPLGFAMIAEHMIGTNLFNTAGAADPKSLPPLYMYLPFSTISGLYLILPATLHGIRGVLVDKFSLASLRDFAVRYRPKSLGLPIPALHMMLEEEVPPEEFSSLNWISTGTAALDPSVQHAFEDKFGIPVLLAYGATEFGGPATFFTYDLYQEWGQKKFGSVGRPFAGTELRVVDPETGDVLAPGQEGLLEIKTRRIGPDWIRTSDLGVIDEDGFLFHKGRADGAIVRGGFKILPESIEKALNLHDAISAVAVTGIPDERLGQVPAAAIQLKPGVAPPSIEALKAHVREHAPATHVPAQWRFVETLPYNSMLKVDRTALKALFD